MIEPELRDALLCYRTASERLSEAQIEFVASKRRLVEEACRGLGAEQRVSRQIVLDGVLYRVDRPWKDPVASAKEPEVVMTEVES